MRSVIAVAALISAVSAWGPPGSTWSDGSWGTSTWGPAPGPTAWGTGTAAAWATGTAWASGAGPAGTWTSTGPPIPPATGAASHQYPIIGAAAAVGMAALAL